MKGCSSDEGLDSVSNLKTVQAFTSAQFLNAQKKAGKIAAERAFNKLARTYTTQMDAFKRYRAKAQQTVRVEQVAVHEGGQAIVGSVSNGGGNAK
jgi:hypothetical protein